MWKFALFSLLATLTLPAFAQESLFVKCECKQTALGRWYMGMEYRDHRIVSESFPLYKNEASCRADLEKAFEQGVCGQE